MDASGPSPAASIAQVYDANAMAVTPEDERSQTAQQKARTRMHNETPGPQATQSAQRRVGVSRSTDRQATLSIPAKSRRHTYLRKTNVERLLIRNNTFDSKLDDICRYGLSAGQVTQLYRLENTRLSAAMMDGITRNPFTSTEDNVLAPDDHGFKTLSIVAGEIIGNIAICNFDNQVSFFEFQSEFFDADELSLARKMISESPKFTAEAKQNRRFYCALVDYVTSVAARCASYNPGEASWHEYCMSSLAKSAAKLKFLSVDSGDFANQSLENGQQILAMKPQKVDQTDASKSAQIASASSWALQTLLPIFRDLKGERPSGLSRKAFNISNIVYNTGWKDVPILLSHNQYGEISGTSVRSVLWHIQGVFETLNQVAGVIEVDQSSRQVPSPTVSSKCASIEVHFRHHPSSNPEINSSNPVVKHPDPLNKDFTVNTLTDIVSLMVPLLFMQPERLQQLKRTSGFVTETPFVSNYSAFYQASNAQFSAFAKLQVYDAEHTNPMWLRATEIHDFESDSSLSVVRSLLPWNAGKSGMESQSSTAQSWAIEEKSIVVTRQFYVIMTMTACGMLVVGGILAGLLVGERISGVDPFNIATFAWVLAAFVILIAKSLLVREWPWRDFLRGQVPCRSVSELHTVTGIDEQAILRYLLAKDAYTMLTTRGPFNLFFTRRSEDGFSIDVKMDLRTILASGILVVRVTTHMGPALVCLDLRRGAEGRKSIRHFDGPQEGESLLGCFDFPEAIDGPLDVQLQTLSQAMTWRQILGIYNRMDKKFR